MLQFIVGKSASGKTYKILEKIKELSNSSKNVVLIVPEQYTFESERNVLKTIGDKAALNVEVLSFSRICDEVNKICGGLNATVLGDADKIIFMHRALSIVKDDLKLWGRYSSNVTFASNMLDTLGEFKINAILPNDIRNVSNNIESTKLKAKLSDIALIYETYDMLVGEKFIDPADRLTKLYYRLENCDFFENKTVFIDSFKGFTGQQFKIIERILSKAQDVYITFTDNVEITKEYNIFTNIRKSKDKLIRIAKNHFIDIEEPIVLNNNFYNSKSIESLEKILCGNDDFEIQNDNTVEICIGTSSFDEAEFCARTIRQLVRTNNYRFKDFVIIARDSDSYEDAVVSASEKNDISVFYDKRISLSVLPIAVAVTSAINALDISTENILKFHKSGLSPLNLDEISTIENYAYLWNIDGKMWLNNWDMSIKGFVSSDYEDENDSEQIDNLNRIRKIAVEPILNFKENFHGNAKTMSKAIVNLLKNCNVSENLISIGEKIENSNIPFSEDILKQGYDLYMDILESLVTAFGDATITKEQFIDALNIAVSNTTIGVIPQCLDQVTFGSADRIRPSRPKIAFILGANQGVFPKSTSNAGLFNIIERKYLIESGLEIADNSIYSTIDEEFLVYSNLCCATDKLYICYHTSSLTGEKCEKASFVDNVINKLSPNIVYEPQNKLDDLSLPETNIAAFSEFCKRINGEPDIALSLAKALENSDQKDKIAELKRILENTKKQISSDTAKKLYGKNIYMSATKFDTYNRCKFSYFCKYGLKAKKLQPADFDVLQRGTIVHFVLERFIEDYKEEIANLEENLIFELCDKYIEEYLSSVSGFCSVRTAKTEFLISKISRSLKDVLLHLSDEFKQTKFKPVGCELKIGGDGIPLEFPFSDGTIKINGSIDRIDEYNGYVRIVDYKTGSKSFKLPDALFGLNMQMLLYLYAVIRGRNITDDKAAGILYMPSKRDINDKGMAMNGLLVSDVDIIKAMDQELLGEYVPKLNLKNDGTISKTNKSFISSDDFTVIFDYIESLMAKVGNEVLNGNIEVSPLDGRESPACSYCDFSHICGIEDKEAERVPELNNEAVFSAMKGEDLSAD